jgi:hypothetical protein
MKYSKSFQVIFLISVLFLLSCNDKKAKNHDEEKDMTELSESEKPEEKTAFSNKNVTESSMPNADIPLDTILGRWLRPDGNYVIQINSIDSEKQIDAQYFNPRPIKIARAELIPAGSNLRIFIEFDDEGYKGSSYDLIYDPAQDALSGKYFQATYGQTYQIAFVRLKE